jgi:cyclase
MSTVHHDITTPAPPRLQEVDDGVFAYIQPDGTWWINNTGFLVGQRGAGLYQAPRGGRRIL